jgi:hypothetical protein
MKTLKAVTTLFLLSNVSAIAADFPSIKSAPGADLAQILKGFHIWLNADGMRNTNNSINIQISLR